MLCVFGLFIGGNCDIRETADFSHVTLEIERFIKMTFFKYGGITHPVKFQQKWILLRHALAVL